MSPTAEQVNAEMSALLRRLAEPVSAGESIKACIRRAATRAGLTYGQTKRIWYAETKIITAQIADQLRERASAHDRKLQQAAFQAVLAMQDTDPALYRECVETLRDLLGEHGQGQRSGGSRG